VEQWWILEVPDAQTAFEAVVVTELIRAYDVTAVRIVARTELDLREHLYVCMRTSREPKVDEARDRALEVFCRLGDPTALTMADLVDRQGLLALATGRPATMIAYLMWLYPGRYRVDLREGTPPIIWGE
jgi:hypothetical protein